MHEQPTLADYDIVLWKIKPSDIDDRLQIGRHHEFITYVRQRDLGKAGLS